MNKNIIDKFFRVRDMYEKEGDAEAIVFLRHIWIYLYDYNNELTSAENVIIIPGQFSLITATLVLDQLGYYNYSVEHIPAGKVYKCVSTKITFRSTL